MRSPSPFETPDDPPLRLPCVLLAEDDVEMRRLLAQALRREGCEVIEASDGNGLFLQITSRIVLHGAFVGIDVVISDVRMPGRDGLTIAEILRGAAIATPIILMTAFGDDDLRARARALDVQLFDKPFDVDRLRVAVRGLVAPAKREKGSLRH